jgi:DNA adenine methylase
MTTDQKFQLIVQTQKMQVKPFLKWVGGKTRVLPFLLNNIPAEYEAYHEPFVGGGALFFNLQPKKAYLSDANKDLINAYKQVRENIEEIITGVSFHISKSDRSYYMQMVKKFNTENLTDLERAVLFIYINHSGFRGLLRYNSKGHINTSYGRDIHFNAENMRKTSKLLNNAHIKNCSVFDIIPEKGHFYYLDPPYAGDVEKPYSYDFNQEDQINLANLCEKINVSGAKFMLSNSSNDFTNDIYKNYNVEKITLFNDLSATAGAKRTEILVRNY